jgi:hypothetical protein
MATQIIQLPGNKAHGWDGESWDGDAMKGLCGQAVHPSVDAPSVESVECGSCLHIIGQQVDAVIEAPPAPIPPKSPEKDTQGLMIDSIAPAIRELERAMEWASRDLAGMDVHLVPTIQTRGRSARCMGTFTRSRWSTKEGEVRAEINFSAEYLNREPYEVIGTAIHEITHAWNFSRGIEDVATNGRHNKRFKAAAVEMGLDVRDPTDSYGYGYTTVGEALRERITDEFKPDHAAMNLFMLTKPPREGTAKTRAWVCDCSPQFTVRVAAKLQLEAECQMCGASFRLKGKN